MMGSEPGEINFHLLMIQYVNDFILSRKGGRGGRDAYVVKKTGSGQEKIRIVLKNRLSPGFLRGEGTALGWVRPFQGWGRGGGLGTH
jgi:hypothetical protein